MSMVSTSVLVTDVAVAALFWTRVSRRHKLLTMGYLATAGLIIVIAYYSTIGIHCGSTHNVIQGELRAQQAIADRLSPKVGVVLDTSQPITTNNAVGINWNRVIDFIIDLARKDILRLDRAEVDLPEIAEVFTNTVLLVKLRGEFKADKGRLSDLSTVQRTSDVKVTRQGKQFTITAALGLAMVQLRYGHYRAKINNVGSINGYIKGSVGKNSIRVTATIDVKDGKCTAVLNEVKVIELEGLKIKVSGSGFGPLNWLITKMTNSYAQKNREDIMVKIEQGLSGVISKAIKEFHCEQYIGLLVL